MRNHPYTIICFILAFTFSGCFIGKSTKTSKTNNISEKTVEKPELQKQPQAQSTSEADEDFILENRTLAKKEAGRVLKAKPKNSRQHSLRLQPKKGGRQYALQRGFAHHPPRPPYYDGLPLPQNSESYTEHGENPFKLVTKAPLSTFSIDVDAASYSNLRRFLNNNQLPPSESIRYEEMINYFQYDYKGPSGKHPFAVHMETSPAPWNTKHQLVHIGLKGKELPKSKRPASNLVFLLDVSGSMNNPQKLPLLKKSFELLINQLGEDDKISIVVYAGAAGVVLEPTPGNHKRKIMEALGKLNAGGSTAGGAGIKLAYKLAEESFVKKGNNRIILATDGDFNIGASSDKAMEDLIEAKRQSGVFLTVLGFGMGNYKDSKMEILADKGNGNYAYIDNILEAKKVFIQELGSTLFTIAKDVKLQVEFNPAFVSAYRLIGYENRKLQDSDFNNDKKDAGELGAGHTVTALYEIIPVGIKSEFTHIDPLKYQAPPKVDPLQNKEILTLKLRYKKPEGDKSKLITHVLKGWDSPVEKPSINFRWAAAVAAFGMRLKKSEFLGTSTWQSALTLAREAKGTDLLGYRAEFIRLMEKAELLQETEISRSGNYK